MSESILFSLPQVLPGDNPAYDLLWYQSVDGLTWNTPAVDMILVAALTTDTDTGKYLWTSILADPLKYHQIRTRDISGVENPDGFILPPKQADPIETDYYGIKSDDGYEANILPSFGLPVYDIGDTINLTLQVDYSDALVLGPTLPIEIKDPFGNVIVTLTANLVNDIYTTEWVIPLSIHKKYNAIGVTDTSPSNEFYFLKDNWIFPDGILSFDFLVKRRVESPILNNCEYRITIEGVLAEDNNIVEPMELRFSSLLSPYYASLYDVKSTLVDEMGAVDDFDLVKDIILQSKQVDLHMKPEVIYRQEQFDLAVKMFVKYSVARMHLMFLLNINAESKQLDMLKYSRNSNDPRYIIANIDELIKKYALIIWAGGKDTPFIPKTFTKGVYDPNRTNANRLGLDTSDPYPWVNSTTNNQIVNINGNTVELRGTRTVSFMKNRSSFPNTYLRSEGTS